MKNEIKRRRMGRFTIPTKTMYQEPEAATQIISLLEFLPFRVEFLGHSQMVEFIGTSPQFQELSPGSIAPDYSVTTQENDNGEIIGVSVLQIK